MHRHTQYDIRWGSRRLTRRGSSRTLSSETNNSQNSNKDTISLQRLLLDAYEYQGLNDLLLYGFFFAISVLALIFQWGPTTAAFKSNVLETYKSVNDATSVYAGVQQMFDFVQTGLDVSESLAIHNNTEMWIDQYGKATFVRMVADLETPCKLRLRDGPSCYRNFTNKDELLQDFLNSWARLPGDREDYLRSVILVSQNNATHPTRAAMIKQLKLIRARHSQVIAKYAYIAGLNVVGFDRVGSQGALFNIWIGISEDPDNTPDHKLAKLSTTLPFQTSMWDTKEMKISLAFFALFSILTLYYTFYELQWYKLCTLQYASKIKYFAYWWNDFQMISILLCYIWVAWYMYLLWYLPNSDLQWPQDNRSFGRLQNHALLYTAWIYFGVFVTFVLGVRLCRYMRIHTGLKAFYQVFYDVARDMLDFAVFFVYVLVVLNLFLYSVFQISGGNPNWLRFDNGMTMLGRLMFNMLDYNEEFSNEGTGIGSNKTILTAVFWLVVLFLVLFSQNIMLAIFVSAYERAKQKSLQVEYSFLSLVWHRGIFAGYSIWHHVKRYAVSCCGTSERNTMDLNEDMEAAGQGGFLSPDSSVAGDDLISPRTRSDGRPDQNGGVGANGSTIANRQGSRQASLSNRLVSSVTSVTSALPTAMRQFSYKLLESRFQFGLHFLRQVNSKESFNPYDRNLLYARWAISQLREMKAVVAYFQDFGTLKLRKECMWRPVGAEAHDSVTISATSCLKQSQLKQFLEAVVMKQKVLDQRKGFWFRWFHSRPFKDLPEDAVEFLCRAIWEVYHLVPNVRVDDRRNDLGFDKTAELIPASRGGAPGGGSGDAAVVDANKQLTQMVAALTTENHHMAQQLREQAARQARMEQRMEELVKLATRMAVSQTDNMPRV